MQNQLDQNTRQPFTCHPAIAKIAKAFSDPAATTVIVPVTVGTVETMYPLSIFGCAGCDYCNSDYAVEPDDEYHAEVKTLAETVKDAYEFKVLAATSIKVYPDEIEPVAGHRIEVTDKHGVVRPLRVLIKVDNMTATMVCRLIGYGQVKIRLAGGGNILHNQRVVACFTVALARMASLWLTCREASDSVSWEFVVPEAYQAGHYVKSYNRKGIKFFAETVDDPLCMEVREHFRGRLWIKRPTTDGEARAIFILRKPGRGEIMDPATLVESDDEE